MINIFYQYIYIYIEIFINILFDNVTFNVSV